MELSTDDFIAIFGEELQTREYDEMLAERYPMPKPPSKEELGEVSYQNLKDRAKKKGIDLKDLAESLDLTPRGLHDGVVDGRQFPRKPPGTFDRMCRELGFQPSEARTVLGGIYEAMARGERIEARMSINEKLQEMHAVYQKIVDPAKRSTAEFVIDTLWRQLNELADSQG